jgi:hypothetical protein
MAGLLRRDDGNPFGRELKPENWQTYHFDGGLTMFDVRRAADELEALQPAE